MDELLPDDAQQPDEDRPIVQVLDRPISVRFRYGTPEHARLLSRLNSRLDLSHRHMSQRHETWKEIDDVMRMHIDTDRASIKSDGSIDSTSVEHPFEKGLVIPLSFAIAQVRSTQLMGIRSARNPLLGIRGVGPEDMESAPIMEAALAHGCDMSDARLELFTLDQDADRYGAGVIFDTWDEVKGYKRLPPSQLQMLVYMLRQKMGRPAQRPQGKRIREVVDEFTRWEAVDPGNFFPDPRVSLARFQQGEFAGHRCLRPYLYINELSEEKGGHFFNVKALKEERTPGDAEGRRGNRAKRLNVDLFDLTGSDDADDHGYHVLENIEVSLIPREWELDPSEELEKWWFTVADERVVIRAHPAAYDHDEFTYGVAQSNYDAHQLFNPGTIELLLPTQRRIDWLVGSHIENVMRELNNALVYLPSIIEEGDLLNPGPAAHLRLTRYGEKMVLSGALRIEDAFRQLQVIDITGGHLNLVNQLSDFAQRMAAASDPQMSMPSDDKRTLGEMQMVLGASSQRVGILAKLIDLQAVRPLARRAISNIQQFLSMAQYGVIVGQDALNPMAQRALFAPEMFAGRRYDYVPIDTTEAPDPARSAEALGQFMQAAGSIPQLQMPDAAGRMLNMHMVFAEFAKSLGIRNVENFFVNIKPMLGPGSISVAPDEEVARGVQSGRLQPV